MDMEVKKKIIGLSHLAHEGAQHGCQAQAAGRAAPAGRAGVLPAHKALGWLCCSRGTRQSLRTKPQGFVPDSIFGLMRSQLWPDLLYIELLSVGRPDGGSSIHGFSE